MTLKRIFWAFVYHYFILSELVRGQPSPIREIARERK